jgi:hypothetical protein
MGGRGAAAWATGAADIASTILGAAKACRDIDLTMPLFDEFNASYQA